MKFCEKYTDNSYIISNDCRKLIPLKDKGTSTYIGENDNEKRIIVYQIDNGIIKSQSVVKCDYGLYNWDEDIIYLIELKGTDYDQAIEQITSTINLLITQCDINSVNARIVLTKVRTPEIGTTKEKKLKILLKKYNGTLEKKSKVMTEKI